jgi:VanZ family protein
LTILVFLLPLTLRANLSNIQRARQKALCQPQNFLVKPQPISTSEIPQPDDIQWHGKRNFLIFYFFILYFVISFILFYFVENFAFTIKHTIVTLVTALLFALSMTVVSMFSSRRTAKVTIRLTQAGISSYVGATESSMKWEDARLFACYQERLLWRTRKTVQYELVSEQTIVRWGQPKSLKILQAEPPMNQQQFEQWHEQLRGYVVERTGLPLVELRIDKAAH